MRMSRWLGGSVAVVAALVATAAGAVAVAGGVDAADAGRPQTLTSAEDAVLAQLAAKASGRRVEIDGLKTETTQVFANPSGTFTSEQSAMPVRVRRNGAWVPVNITLELGTDGMVRPVASPTAVAFSGGGNAPLVRIARLDKELTLGWPGRLPTPVLAGDTATYRGVLPEVDLQLRATRDGFSQVLIVRSRAATNNPALSRIRFTTQTRGLSLAVDAEGAITAVDRTGTVVFAAGRPMMWDSSEADAEKDIAKTLGSGRSSVGAPGAGAHRSAMTVQVSAGELAVTPDRTKLTAPDATYPYYIDPPWAGGPAAWTMINSTYPNQSYWAYDRADCPGGVQCAKVGYTTIPTAMVYRSLFQFPVTNWRGTHVLQSTFSMTCCIHGAVPTRPPTSG